MKTKLLFLKVISIAFILNSCSTTLPLNRTKTIIETSFDPKSVQKEIEKNLNLTIQPINADGINKEILNSLTFDGSYYSETNNKYYGYINEEKNFQMLKKN